MPAVSGNRLPGPAVVFLKENHFGELYDHLVLMF
jgi:hypothetical protein